MNAEGKIKTVGGNRFGFWIRLFFYGLFIKLFANHSVYTLNHELKVYSFSKF